VEDEESGRSVWPSECIETFTFEAHSELEVFVEPPVQLSPVTLKPVRWWAVVWEIDRAYGGPEEGGWWFDTGTLVVKVPCVSSQEAENVADKLRERYAYNGSSSSVVYNGGDYSVGVSKNEPGEYFPEHRPHYA
jgi:hypothetical protein